VAGVGRVAHRLRVVPVVGAARRLLTVARLALLIAVLIGLAGPAALRAAIEGRTRSEYTVALRHELEAAGELAAVAVANLLQAPDLGKTEVVQLLTEYLSGLVENGPVKDFFTSWAERTAGEPPATERLVVPNPQSLELAASLTLNEERRKQLLPITSLPEESPIDASVDLANQARYLQERTGPCAGCRRPARSRDDPHEVPREHPIIRPDRLAVSPGRPSPRGRRESRPVPARSRTAPDPRRPR
jgi:hypothetical protein